MLITVFIFQFESVAIKCLLKFQRILFAELMNIPEDANGSSDEAPEEPPAMALLVRYTKLLVAHCEQILEACQMHGSTLSRYMYTLHEVVASPNSIVGALLPEFVISCLALETRRHRRRETAELATLVAPLLDQLDAVNRRSPAASKEDADNLSWTGLNSLTCSAKERYAIVMILC